MRGNPGTIVRIKGSDIKGILYNATMSEPLPDGRYIVRLVNEHYEPDINPETGRQRTKFCHLTELQVIGKID